MEALFVGCTTKSHKGSKESELINKGSEEAHIRYISEKNERQTKVEIHLKKRGTKKHLMMICIGVHEPLTLLTFVKENGLTPCGMTVMIRADYTYVLFPAAS